MSGTKEAALMNENPVHTDGDLTYEIIIGCEIHCELLTKTKAFCSCENRYGGLPNTRVCPVCLGLPGAMPVVGKEYVEFGAIAGFALGCEVSRFQIRPQALLLPRSGQGLSDYPVRPSVVHERPGPHQPRASG